MWITTAMPCSKPSTEPLHQTVGWAIEQLKQYPPDAQLRFASGPGETLFWLSDYSMKEGHVYIDVGNE